jgi:hypothetical protein
MWPQCWDLQGPRGLEQRDLRNLNLGDLKKGPNGGVSPTQPKKKRPVIGFQHVPLVCCSTSLYKVSFQKKFLTNVGTFKQLYLYNCNILRVTEGTLSWRGSGLRNSEINMYTRFGLICSPLYKLMRSV